MKIKIIETGKIEELNIIDPKSGVNWINDLMGNHGALPEYDEDSDYYLMSLNDFEWWDNLIDAYQSADNRHHDLLSRLDEKSLNNFVVEIEDNTAVDLEDLPRVIHFICDKYEWLQK